jgi:hypothetical protein
VLPGTFDYNRVIATNLSNSGGTTSGGRAESLIPITGRGHEPEHVRQLQELRPRRYPATSVSAASMREPVLRKKSRRDRLKPVLVMKTGENWFRSHPMPRRKLLAGRS